jgi:hypothetical protein
MYLQLEGNRLLKRLRRRTEDSIKMDLRDIDYGGADWIYVAKDEE